MKKVKVLIGKMYMKSGAQIPFATANYVEEEGFTFKTKWCENSSMRICEVDGWNPVLFDNIPMVNFISWSNVEGMVCEEEIEVSEEEFEKRGRVE